MGKPSSLTAGDGISFAVEMTKLLAPVLKNTDRDKIERLKHNPKLIQETVNRILEGEDAVRDYGIPDDEGFIRCIKNESEITFAPHFCFKVFTKLSTNTSSLRILIQTWDRRRDDEEVWEFEFEKFMPPVFKGIYVSLESFLIPDTDPYSSAYENLISERGKLSFRRDYNSDENNAPRYLIGLQCGSFDVEEEIDVDKLKMLE